MFRIMYTIYEKNRVKRHFFQFFFSFNMVFSLFRGYLYTVPGIWSLTGHSILLERLIYAGYNSRRISQYDKCKHEK